MSDLHTITAIVPRLPPAIDGLGDYGLNLAKQLRQDFGLLTEFVIGDPHWSAESLVEGFVVQPVKAQSSNFLLDLLLTKTPPRNTICLHYVGYGYAKRGCPVWLVDGLERWRNANSHRYLVTMFHEIYAFGPIWTSQFWTSPLQKNLATRLIRLSDRCLTSKQEYAEIVQKLSGGKHLRVPALPVFSNVGEPKHLQSLPQRSRRLVIFGNRGSRSRVYQRSLSVLQRTCQELEIEEIVDIGPTLSFPIQPVNGIPVSCLGLLSADEISNLLSNSIVGFFDYHTAYLAKSGIFAAYCAHRLLPIGVWYEGQDVDGLEAGKHYWLGDKYQQKMDLSIGQIVADNAYAWYQEHQLSRHADTFKAYLTNF